MVEGSLSFQLSLPRRDESALYVENHYGRSDCEIKSVTHAPAFRVHSTGLERVTAAQTVSRDFSRSLVSRRSMGSSNGTPADSNLLHS